MTLVLENAADIQKALLELAHVRQDSEAGIANLDRDINEIKVAKEALVAYRDKVEKETREAILTYMQETGDLKAHPNVTFQRRKKLAYDKEEALMYVVVNDRRGLYRSKPELDVRAFENALKADTLADFQWEEINVPTLEIGKLGDLLVMEQNDAE